MSVLRNKKKLNYYFVSLMLVKFYPISIICMLYPVPEIIIQLAFYLIMLLLLLRLGAGGRFEISLLLLVVSAIFSILANDANEKYSAPIRLIIWILLIMSVGPLYYNVKLVHFRNKLYQKVMAFCMLIGAVSCLYWIVGIPSIGMGHFSGLINHSMTLAPIASLGALYAFYLFIQSDTKQKKLFLIMFILNIISLILAASRSAFVAFVVAFCVFLYFDKFPFRKICVMFLLIVAPIYALQLDDLTPVQSKTETVFSRGNISENTREALWDDRLKEFASSPVIGVGFAAQDDSIIDVEAGNEGGQVEPGSTYLMILSMTGAIGGVFFLLFILKVLLSKNLLKNVAIFQNYKLASLVFFMMHFIAEGYVYSGGSFLSFVFWLLLGSIFPYSKVKYTEKNTKDSKLSNLFS